MNISDYGPSKRKLGAKCLDLDLFGQSLTLGIRGREKFDTFLGSTLSVIMTLLLITATTFFTIKIFIQTKVEDIQQLRFDGHYGPKDEISFSKYDVSFAIGVSSTTKFDFQTREQFETYADWKVKLIRQQADADDIVVFLDMEPCQDYHPLYDHHNPQKQKVIKAHMDEN